MKKYLHDIQWLVHQCIVEGKMGATAQSYEGDFGVSKTEGKNENLPS